MEFSNRDKSEKSYRKSLNVIYYKIVLFGSIDIRCAKTELYTTCHGKT